MLLAFCCPDCGGRLNSLALPQSSFKTLRLSCDSRANVLTVFRLLFLTPHVGYFVSLHATTVSSKPSFRAPWRVGNAVVGGSNAGLTTSKSGHPCPCQNCTQGPPAEKTGEGSLVNRSSCPTDGPVGQWAELNYVQRAGWPFPLQRLLDGLVIIVIIFVTCDD